MHLRFIQVAAPQQMSFTWDVFLQVSIDTHAVLPVFTVTVSVKLSCAHYTLEEVHSA